MLENENKRVLSDGRVLYTLDNGKSVIMEKNPSEESLAEFAKRKNAIKAFEEKGQDVAKLENGSWTDDPLVASRMILDGMTLGWGTEALSAISATSDALQGKDYSESYNQTFNELIKEEQQYRGQYPAASLTLNIAGGLATGGIGALRVGAVKGASALAKGGLATNTAKTLASGAGIGGIAGAGAADTGDRVEGLKSGAVWGAAGLGILKSGGWLYGQSAKKRIAENLGKNNNFIPINLAANYNKQGEGLLGNMYRDFVGATFGGKFSIAQQEKQVLDPLKKGIEEATTAFKISKQQAKDAFEESKFANQLAREDRGFVYKDLQDRIKSRAIEARDLIKADWSKDELIQNRLKSPAKLDQKVQEMESAFRIKAITKSIPSGSTQEEIGDLLSTSNANYAMEKLDNLWLDRGFSMLKNKNFTLDSNKLMQEVGEELKKDPVFAVNKADSMPVLKNMAEFLIERSPGGVIDGNSFTALRSSLGSRANANSDSPQAIVQQMVFKTLQNKLDKQVRGQLSKNDIKEFDGQVEQWKTQILLRDSVTQASTAGKKGSFGADEWVNSIRKNSKSQARQGAGSLRQEADQLKFLSDERTTQLQESISNATRKISETKSKNMKQVMLRQKAMLKRAKKKFDAINRKEKQTFQGAKKASETNQEIQQLEENLKLLQTDFDNLVKNSAGEKGIFPQLAATGLLGTVGAGIAGVSGAATGIAIGTGIGKALSIPTVQRVIAGQTPLQNIMRSNTVPSAPLTVATPGMFGLSKGREEEEKKRYGY
tara:strand:+ start:847 stop:3162 length:2316 start_codon:yes stop_codon:yes gene_type:complete